MTKNTEDFLIEIAARLRTGLSEAERLALSNHSLEFFMVIKYLLAATLCAGSIFAQSPWQGTFTKTFHAGDRTTIFIDLPLPPLNKILTVRSVGVKLGPTLSSYSKMFYCEVQSASPRLFKAALVDDTVRVQLPVPSYSLENGRWWFIPDSPVLIYADATNDSALRVACKAENLGTGETFVVTAVGELKDK